MVEMELIPALEIGWLNGWILLCLLYLIFGILLMAFPKDVVARLYDYDRSGWSKTQRAFYVNFKNTPLDQPVTRGLYGISRHPQVLMLFISAFGICIAIGSWLVLFIAIISSLFLHSRDIAEKKACLERYGDSYRAYMKRVPSVSTS